MKILSNEPTAFIDFEAVDSFFKNYRGVITSKRESELFIGYLYAHFFPTELRKSLKIAWPVGLDQLGEVKKGNLSLKSFLESKLVMEDHDVDLYFITAMGTLRVQILRYILHKGKNADPNLVNLILKKCKKYQVDRKLNLVVALEHRPQTSPQGFQNLLQTERSSIPFGGIFLVGKIPCETKTVFSVTQIFPQVVTCRHVSIPINLAPLDESN